MARKDRQTTHRQTHGERDAQIIIYPDRRYRRNFGGSGKSI